MFCQQFFKIIFFVSSNHMQFHLGITRFVLHQLQTHQQAQSLVKLWLQILLGFLPNLMLALDYQILFHSRHLLYLSILLYTSISSQQQWSRHQESNLDLSLRRTPFYPLNYSELAGLAGIEPTTFVSKTKMISISPKTDIFHTISFLLNNIITNFFQFVNYLILLCKVYSS